MASAPFSDPFTGTLIGAFSPGGRRGEPALTIELRFAHDGETVTADLYYLAAPDTPGQSPRTRLTRPLRCPAESVRPLVDWLAAAALAAGLERDVAESIARPGDD